VHYILCVFNLLLEEGSCCFALTLSRQAQFWVKTQKVVYVFVHVWRVVGRRVCVCVWACVCVRERKSSQMIFQRFLAQRAAIYCFFFLRFPGNFFCVRHTISTNRSSDPGSCVCACVWACVCVCSCAYVCKRKTEIEQDRGAGGHATVW